MAVGGRVVIAKGGFGSSSDGGENSEGGREETITIKSGTYF